MKLKRHQIIIHANEHGRTTRLFTGTSAIFIIYKHHNLRTSNLYSLQSNFLVATAKEASIEFCDSLYWRIELLLAFEISLAIGEFHFRGFSEISVVVLACTAGSVRSINCSSSQSYCGTKFVTLEIYRINCFCRITWSPSTEQRLIAYSTHFILRLLEYMVLDNK